MADLDELDTAILRELQSDARKTNREVAASVGVSPTTALDRTRSLRQRGVIRGAILGQRSIDAAMYIAMYSRREAHACS